MIMSTQATADAISTYVDTRSGDKSGGFFKRAFAAYTDARMQSARAAVGRELAGLSNAHLKSLGLNDAQVKTLRDTGRLID